MSDEAVVQEEAASQQFDWKRKREGYMASSAK